MGVRDRDEIFDFEFFDSGDPTQSRVHSWLAIEFEWEDRDHVEFTFSNPPAAPADDEAGNDSVE